MTTTHIKALKTFMRSDGQGFAQPGDVMEIHHADLPHYVQHGMGQEVDVAEKAADTDDKPARKAKAA